MYAFRNYFNFHSKFVVIEGQVSPTIFQFLASVGIGAPVRLWFGDELSTSKLPPSTYLFPCFALIWCVCWFTYALLLSFMLERKEFANLEVLNFMLCVFCLFFANQLTWLRACGAGNRNSSTKALALETGGSWFSSPLLYPWSWSYLLLKQDSQRQHVGWVREFEAGLEKKIRKQIEGRKNTIPVI